MRQRLSWPSFCNHGRHKRLITKVCRQRGELRPPRISPPRQFFVVAGSRGNGLPAGLALHAELKALSAAGRGGEQALYAAGRNAAQLLGLQNQIGTIAPGATADMLLVNGDPLSQSGDALNIVAVVRNGRIFSLVRLLDRAPADVSVE